MISSTSCRCSLSPSLPPMLSTMWLMGRWNRECYNAWGCTGHERCRRKQAYELKGRREVKGRASSNQNLTFPSDMHSFVGVRPQVPRRFVLFFRFHCLRFIFCIICISGGKNSVVATQYGWFPWILLMSRSGKDFQEEPRNQSLPELHALEGNVCLYRVRRVAPLHEPTAIVFPFAAS